MTILGALNKLSKATLDCSFDLIDDIAYIASEFSRSIMILFLAPLLVIQIILDFLCNVERKMK